MNKFVFLVLMVSMFVAGCSDDTTSTEAETEAEVNMITPADMSEQAQNEMYGAMVEYNKCVILNRPEYHQPGAKIVEVADKTLAECEIHLDTLKEVLTKNNVNEGLREGMVKTIRTRSARKLMSILMQSMVGQAAAAENAKAMPAE